MTRAVIQGLVLFLLPFVLFAVYLVVRRRNPLLWSHWSDQSLWLTIASGSIVVVQSTSVTGRPSNALRTAPPTMRVSSPRPL